MKGIILAGGSGTRLFPATMSTIKQLLPVYDKPMVYYPLSILMMAGVRDILIISTPKDLPRFKDIFSDGSQLGVNFSYKEQLAPNGIAEAFVLGDEFISSDSVWLVLGDNIFYGHSLPNLLKRVSAKSIGATVFGYYVNDPERYGVVEFNEKQQAVSIEEKPEHPKSNYAVTGLYYYDKQVVEIAKSIKPSARGELEITAVNNEYLKNGSLEVELMGRGYAWLDTGTHESLLDASNFVRIIEERQGLKLSCIEEIAYKNGWITASQLSKLAQPLSKNQYGQYLLSLIK